MDKVKDVLHIGRKHKEEKADALANSEHGTLTSHDTHRSSMDSELEAMSPDERVRYLKDYDHAEKHGEPKKGSFLDRLISRGNKKTEEQLEQESRAAQAAQTGGAGAGAGGTYGTYGAGAPAQGTHATHATPGSATGGVVG